MDQSLKGTTPIRNKFTKFRLLVPRFEKNHQGDHIKLKIEDGKNKADS